MYTNLDYNVKYVYRMTATILCQIAKYYLGAYADPPMPGVTMFAHL